MNMLLWSMSEGMNSMGAYVMPCGAFPIANYQQWDQEGKAVRGTLCIPPKECGFLKVLDSDDERDETDTTKQTKEEPSPAMHDNRSKNKGRKNDAFARSRNEINCEWIVYLC